MFEHLNRFNINWIVDILLLGSSQYARFDRYVDFRIKYPVRQVSNFFFIEAINNDICWGFPRI